jgi:hypothetical protein
MNLKKTYSILKEQNDSFKKIVPSSSYFGFVIEKNYKKYFVEKTDEEEVEEENLTVVQDDISNEILADLAFNIKKYSQKLKKEYHLDYVDIEYDADYIFQFMFYMHAPFYCHLKTLENAVTYNVTMKDKELITILKYIESFENEITEFFGKIEEKLDIF